MEVASIYKPDFYSNVAALMGHGGFLDQKLLHKAMNDSGFNSILGLIQKAQLSNQPKSVMPTALTKRAYYYRHNMTKEAGWKENTLILSMLLSPFKVFADEGMAATAKLMSDKYYPKMVRQVEDMVGNLGMFKQMGMKAYGVENLAKDMARGQAHVDMVSKFGLPSKPMAQKLQQQMQELNKTVKETGDIDIDYARGVYDDLDKFNAQAEKEILDFNPKALVQK